MKEKKVVRNKSYQIAIYSTARYSWINESQNVKEYMENGLGIKMVLSGAFFVYPQGKHNGGCMTNEYQRAVQFVQREGFSLPPDVFDLVPVNIKEMQMKKY